MAGPLRARLPGEGVAPDEIELGHVLGVFGVRGELRLYLHNRESDALSEPRDVVLIDPQGARYRGRLVTRPGAGLRVIGRLDEVTDPETAAALVGWRIAVAERDLGPLGEGEYYVRHLEGAVVRVGGEEAGVVETVQATAGPDVLVVRRGGELHFVPMVAAWVVAIDTERRIVDLAPGALEEG